MNKLAHFLFELFGFLIIWGIFEEITITMIIIPIFWGTLFPDFDHQIKSHRNIIFHSIIPNFVIFLFDFTLINKLLIISVAIHLLCDLIPTFRKKGGYSCIHYWFGRFSTVKTRIWFVLNILGSIIIWVMM